MVYFWKFLNIIMEKEKKIDNMTSGDFDQNKIVEFKLEEEK